ncbi:hypothetical protein B0H69_004878 [Clostridium beijerinckii]|jgi:hypothetical protein|nr:hypothetical protein [Clostridium beijerinckii]NRT23540.1 hypothetical protein [Clostridium beijerinckii]NRT68887.1 hypothetical protein [Clostridium beijerinckii]NRT84960.1 hypothetical protein [Clostridium beijerinckii]NRU48472.1 hypothetical protein [Clostridium beijerinckii]
MEEIDIHNFKRQAQWIKEIFVRNSEESSNGIQQH